jgi:hypothetical protein
MVKETRRKDAWGEYLRGEYTINDRSYKDKMRWEIRQIANRAMNDLLLICQKVSDTDKVLIFKNPETRKNLVIPLIIALESTSERGDDTLESTMALGESLLAEGIKFKVPLLLKSARYQQRKHIELLCKWGIPRKYAKERAAEHAKISYPIAHLRRIRT